MLSTRFVVLTALGAAALALPAAAQDWPNGDIRYILHVEPGGATDVMARRMADGLQRDLGVNVVVENRAGGSGARQVAQMQRARPDGQTIGSVTASHLGMFQQTGQFDMDSVEWACGLVLDPYLIAVRTDSSLESLGDLVSAAKENPGSLSVAGFGESSGGEVAWMMFMEAAGLEDDSINWVPYNSVGDGVVATLGGHNQIVIAYPGLVRQHVEAGTLRVLGVMADERLDMLPDSPTYAEAGFDVNTSWQQFRGVIMPPETPIEVQTTVCNAVEKVLETPALQQYIADSELVPGFMPPEEFRAFVEAQNELTTQWAQ
ncbi:tripartite tricarboxylate transporter substrate binding protein [Paracoccus sp. Z118]|uniref:tripartite tricarboxylate transporter substrate binding protein n=1 Tax=Paracoccus sp. Z118 TaxID=2851017 RepID=UPI001C2C5DD1|nr:tripartite tricarboxylate transporter substrate binding protein [Paracoccus sp. Z118]MBV0893241.1 tripartite tricarboxylate transporter substrate binding protein [Paracoccus sp. Z118]